MTNSTPIKVVKYKLLFSRAPDTLYQSLIRKHVQVGGEGTFSLYLLLKLFPCQDFSYFHAFLRCYEYFQFYNRGTAERLFQKDR